MKRTPPAVAKWFEGRGPKPSDELLRRVAHGNYFYSQEARDYLAYQHPSRRRAIMARLRRFPRRVGQRVRHTRGR